MSVEERNVEKPDVQDVPEDRPAGGGKAGKTKAGRGNKRSVSGRNRITFTSDQVSRSSLQLFIFWQDRDQKRTKIRSVLTFPISFSSGAKLHCMSRALRTSCATDVRQTPWWIKTALVTAVSRSACAPWNLKFPVFFSWIWWSLFFKTSLSIRTSWNWRNCVSVCSCPSKKFAFVLLQFVRCFPL